MVLPGAETLYYLGRRQGNVTQRAKASGKYTFVPIQNHLTSWPTNHGQSGVLPNSEDRRAFTFSWLLLAPYP